MYAKEQLGRPAPRQGGCAPRPESSSGETRKASGMFLMVSFFRNDPPTSSRYAESPLSVTDQTISIAGARCRSPRCCLHGRAQNKSQIRQARAWADADLESPCSCSTCEPTQHVVIRPSCCPGRVAPCGSTCPWPMLHFVLQQETADSDITLSDAVVDGVHLSCKPTSLSHLDILYIRIELYTVAQTPWRTSGSTPTYRHTSGAVRKPRNITQAAGPVPTTARTLTSFASSRRNFCCMFPDGTSGWSFYLWAGSIFLKLGTRN